MKAIKKTLESKYSGIY